MVNDSGESKSLKGYQKLLEKAQEQEIVVRQDTEGGQEDNVYLFFSFDIVNSSLYKTVNYYGWSIIISDILKEVENRVKKKIINAEVWRILGDEIIFIVKVYDMESIFIMIEQIYGVLISFCNEIEGGEYFDSVRDVPEEIKKLLCVENVLSLKGTAWIAAVTNRKSINQNESFRHIENLYEVVVGNNGQYRFHEFIGIDIDTGFRLSKRTRERQLALSFELAYILSSRTRFLEKLNIITYDILKGVWNDCYYPIVWYYDSEMNERQSLKNSLPFDSSVRDDLYNKYINGENGDGRRPFATEMYEATMDTFEKIKNDRKLSDKIDNLKKIINESKNNAGMLMNNPVLEFHCAAACYNKKGEILLIKRKNRKLMNEKWELGCVKTTTSATLIESLKKEYKETLGIDIEPIIDKRRVDIDPEPIPLAVYSLKKGSEIQKGIIVLAKIAGGTVEPNPSRYSEFLWVSEEGIEKLKQEECVPDLVVSLKDAFELMKEVEDGK